MGGGSGGACLFSKFLRISDKLSFLGLSIDFGIVRATSMGFFASDFLVTSLRTHFDKSLFIEGEIVSSLTIVFCVEHELDVSFFSSESDDITSTYVATLITLSTILSLAVTSL